MQGSTTSSGKRGGGGGFYKGSATSSQADSHDKWNHSGYEEIIKEQ
jgi:hypothetical protein